MDISKWMVDIEYYWFTFRAQGTDLVSWFSRDDRLEER